MLEICQPFWGGREEGDAAFSPQDGSCTLCLCMLCAQIFLQRSLYYKQGGKIYFLRASCYVCDLCKSPVLFWQQAEAAAGEIINISITVVKRKARLDHIVL